MTYFYPTTGWFCSSCGTRNPWIFRSDARIVCCSKCKLHYREHCRKTLAKYLYSLGVISKPRQSCLPSCTPFFIHPLKPPSIKYSCSRNCRSYGVDIRFTITLTDASCSTNYNANQIIVITKRGPNGPQMGREHQIDCTDGTNTFLLTLPIPPSGQYTMGIQAVIHYQMFDFAHGQRVNKYTERSPFTEMTLQIDAHISRNVHQPKLQHKGDRDDYKWPDPFSKPKSRSKVSDQCVRTSKLRPVNVTNPLPVVTCKFKAEAFAVYEGNYTPSMRWRNIAWRKRVDECWISIELDPALRIKAKSKKTGVITLFQTPKEVARSQHGCSVFFRRQYAGVNDLIRCKFHHKLSAELFHDKLVGMASEWDHQKKLQKFIVSKLNLSKNRDRKYNELQLTELMECNSDYKLVLSQFLKSAQKKERDLKEIFIFKIEHKGRAEAHEHKRKQILKSLDGDVSKLNEFGLYHGTQLETLPMILHQGFLRQFVSRAKYGKGTYFARDAKYSSKKSFAKPDKNGFQHLLFCNVICGEWVKGDHTMKVPPNKKNNEFMPHETTVDDEKKPSIFVTYQDDQALPTYLISFKI